jgi:hypothetical protein
MVGSSISLEEPQHFSKRQLGVIYAEEPVNRPRHNAGPCANVLAILILSYGEELPIEGKLSLLSEKGLRKGVYA